MVDYPKDWNKVPVKKFGQIVTGSTPSTNVPKYWNGKYTWITPTDINKTIFMKNSERKLTSEGYEASRKLESGSVLVTCIASIGKNCILCGEGSCNQQINAIVVNENYYNLFIYFLMEHSKRVLENLAGITATKILKKQAFEEIEFIVPKLDEQKGIAETLMTFDKHIENLEKLIEKKKMVRDGAVEDLMTGKTRLEGFEGEWEEVMLNNKCRVFDGTHQTPIYTQTGIKFVSVEDINDIYASTKFISVYDYNRDYKVFPELGDILMTRIGDIGTPALVNKKERVAYYVSLALLKSIKINSEYLYHYISCNAFKTELDARTLHHATPKKINKNEIGKCIIKYPTDIKEQQAIAGILTAMDEEIEYLRQEKEKIEKLKAGAMDDLLTGKIRLIKEA